MLVKIKYANGDVLFIGNVKTFVLQYEENRLVVDDCLFKGHFYHPNPTIDDEQLDDSIIERIIIDDELVYHRTEVTEWD